MDTDMGSDVSVKAMAQFDGGLYCAESVLVAVASEAGIDSPLIPKIASGPCRGVARSGDLCGAVSGGIMAISMLAGRESAAQPIEPVYVLVQKFQVQFAEEFGGFNCRELIGCDLATERGQAEFADQNLAQRCRAMTGQAATLVMQIV